MGPAILLAAIRLGAEMAEGPYSGDAMPRFFGAGLIGILLSCFFVVAGVAAAVLGIIAFFQVLSLKKEVRRLAEQIGTRRQSEGS